MKPHDVYMSLSSIRAHFSCDEHLEGFSTLATNLKTSSNTSAAKSFHKTSEIRCTLSTPIIFK
ncbi:hypothetical protein BpHYR1_006228 [Brachionus plicatilis]|uniref:Uncharacterized protein n=1 Tax=Brachionus plicatilis TaxID=10195 RepID=A0A3M7S847_BRAPC|nr:hypothetical protein BpHYR1_006228 [Brachionus plicatilis]